MNITVVAIGTRGDVEPHQSLCLGLMRAGYAVKLCAPADFASAARALGIPFHPVPVSFRNLMQTPEGDNLLASDANGFRLIQQVRRLAAGVAGRIISGIRDACEEADAVCYSPLGLPAQIFAREMGIPSIATCMQPIAPTRERPSPLLPLPQSTPGWLNAASYVALEELFWQFVRPLMQPYVRGRLRRTGYFGRMWKERRPVLFGFSPSVVPAPGDWKPWMHVTGYWTPPRDAGWRPPESLTRFLAAGPRPVCIGFGSMNSSRIAVILDQSLEMLAQTGRRAVILTGWSGLAPQCAAGNNVFVMDSAPHDWLFPRMSSVIHHGGAGTTAAALRAGAASVIVPFFFDQGFWARWLAARGLGPAAIPFRRISAATLRAAVETAEAAGVRRRVQDLSRRLHKEDGVATAVAIIGKTFGPALRRTDDRLSRSASGAERRPAVPAGSP